MSLKDLIEKINTKLETGHYADVIAKRPPEKPIAYTPAFTKPIAVGLRDKIKRLMGSNSRYEIENLDQLKSTPALEFMKSCKGDALLLGGVGCGKTTAAISIVANEMEPFVKARFLTAYDLSFMIYKRDFEGLEAVEKAHIVIIDDLGTEPEGFKGKDFLAHFENLFATRHRCLRRTIITSNLTIEQIKKDYGDRFISRLRQSGQVFEANNSDMRKQEN